MPWIMGWPNTSLRRWLQNTECSRARQTTHSPRFAPVLQNTVGFLSPQRFCQLRSALDQGTDVFWRYICILCPSTATCITLREHLSHEASVRQGSSPPISLFFLLHVPSFLTWKLLGTNSEQMLCLSRTSFAPTVLERICLFRTSGSETSWWEVQLCDTRALPTFCIWAGGLTNL